VAYVVTRPCLIGHWRQPGEVLTAEELQGRSVHQMEELERTIRFDASIPEPASSKRPVEDASSGDADGGKVSLKDLQARAAQLGVENTDKLKSKAAALKAIEAASADSETTEDNESDAGSDGGDADGGKSSEDESSGED
jgi:hypothetical protein